MSKIAIVTDAWFPQINGVVTAIDKTSQELRRQGHEVRIISPNLQSVFCVSLPSYKEIKIDLFGSKRVRRELTQFAPDYIHIATEGPLGFAARNFCVSHKHPFTTAFHTNFADYVALRSGKKTNKLVHLVYDKDAKEKAYDYLRWFHGPSSGLMASTKIVRDNLHDHGFSHIASLPLGVDTDQFQPYGKNFAPFDQLPRPILLYMGRVAVEKNLDAFLKLDVPGSKVVVGSGPALDDLKKRYPAVHFTGAKKGEDLARHVAAADLFVFPSLTDTFGLVLLEALACGVPVVAYPVQGPKEVLDETTCRGFSRLTTDLESGIREMLDLGNKGLLDIAGARAYAAGRSWTKVAAEFSKTLEACSPAKSQPVYKTKRFPRFG